MHQQREETKYSNNEYTNMPSVDYSPADAPDLCKRNQNRVDFNKVGEICKKHGFNYTLINSTFGGDDTELVVYLKTNEDVALFDKKYDDLTADEKQLRWKITDSYNDTYRKLHECIHELDEQTDLLFRCGWCGNCGLFGSNDVKRMTYSFANGLNSWHNIINRWSPLIHDTTSKLSKGVYIYATSAQLKPQPQNSPALDEYEPTLLKMVRGIIGDKFTANFEEGKRGCDTTSYRALVVRRKRDNDYCGMMTIVRDFIGRYHIRCAAPLCGESRWTMNWENPTEDLERCMGMIL